MRYVWLLFCSIFIISTKYLLKLKYETVIEYAYELVGKQVPLIVISEYLPKDTFNYGRIIFIGVLFILSTVIIVNRKKLASFFLFTKRGLIKSFNAIYQTIRKDFATIGRSRYLFISLPLVIISFQVYQAWFRPLQYDEAWSYNYHIGNSFISSFALPNNHVLYTMVAYFFDKLPFKNEFAIRIPLILAGFCSFVLCYHILRQKFNACVSWVSSIFFYSSCAVTFYTLYARGYVFVIFFSLLFLFAAYNWIKSSLTKKESLIWIFISFILGVYSVPTSLYFFISSFIAITYYVLSIDCSKLKSLIVGGIVSSIIITVLFFPVLFSSHLDNLFNASNSENKVSFSFIVSYMFYNEEFHFGTKLFNGTLYSSALSAFMYLVFVKKEKNFFLFMLSLSGLLIPFIFLAVQKIMLAERIMIHLVIYFTVFIAIVTRWIFFKVRLNKIKNKVYYVLITSGLVVAINLTVASNHSWYTWSISSDTSIKKAVSIMHEMGVTRLYLFPNYPKPAIHYYYKIESKDVSIMMNDPASIDYKPFDSNLVLEAILIETNDLKKFANNEFELIYNDDNYALLRRRS